jgi:hypothetical protein
MQRQPFPCKSQKTSALCRLIPFLQVGAASDHDLVLLKGQLEAARAEGLSAQRQWAAEQQQLKRTAQELWSELQRCHESLTQTVGQVRVCGGSSMWSPASIA